MDAQISELASKYCGIYVGGPWKDAPVEVRPLSGGQSNDVYICSLPEDVRTADGVPRKLIFRFFGEILKQNIRMLLLDNVTFALLSERKIGPRLIGMIPDGRIEEYIPSRVVRTEEIMKPVVFEQIAAKFASFHQIDMPHEKEPTFFFDLLHKWLQTIDEQSLELPTVRTTDLFFAQAGTSSHEGDGSGNLVYDFKEEVNWLMQRMKAHKEFPVVFCHNDLQPGNILTRLDTGQEFDLQFIDYEYCSYNYRGFDLGNHLNEWVFDYTHPTYPYYTFAPQNSSSKEQRRRFFKAYMRSLLHATGESESGDESERERELDQLEVEFLYGSALSHLFWSIWAVIQHKYSTIKFGYLLFSRDRYVVYLERKQHILELEKSTQ